MALSLDPSSFYKKDCLIKKTGSMWRPIFLRSHLIKHTQIGSAFRPLSICDLAQKSKFKNFFTTHKNTALLFFSLLRPDLSKRFLFFSYKLTNWSKSSELWCRHDNDLCESVCMTPEGLLWQKVLPPQVTLTGPITFRRSEPHAPSYKQLNGVFCLPLALSFHLSKAS
jgi:hypothetical protein